ncbi:MAG: hypothetical protein NTV24_05260, partial [Candidatus Woesebacteria bacterium]|nr:hypothetical protein [Candidatus Woesebacteria bacterium]
MDATIYNQKGGLKVRSEKRYSQNEVDDLLKKKKDVLPSEASQIAKEDQTADKQERDDDRTVAGLVKKSNRILVSISSHAFPFDPYPDTINVEEGRITIITRNFFFSSQVHSVDIKDISNIFINMSPFFAQLVIVSKTFAQNEIRIRNLRKKDAILARIIIEGLRIFDS